MIKLLQLLLACSHNSYTWPMRLQSKPYVSCLECGKRIEYDWEEMKLVREVASKHTKTHPVKVEG